MVAGNCVLCGMSVAIIIINYFRETVQKNEMGFSEKGIISKYSEVKSYGSCKLHFLP